MPTLQVTQVTEAYRLADLETVIAEEDGYPNFLLALVGMWFNGSRMR